MLRRYFIIATICVIYATAGVAEDLRLVTTAYAVPAETTSEQSGYFSLIEGHDGKVYIGTAKYGSNAFLVAFDPKTEKMQIVVDCQKEIGNGATGFTAQAKIHTRNNVGPSGKIYFGTKQGYPKEGEKREDYLGGYPMVFDPATGTTRVYDVPVKHQGIISITPDESRGVAYISTCSDERPTESSHFLILDLEKGTYRDLLDTRHMYAFIVIDRRGRAYHPILGGEIARYDPRTDKLDRLKQTINGRPPPEGSLLTHPESHPINWEVTSDGRELFAVPMSENALYGYSLSHDGETLPGSFVGKLIEDAEKTDCRAMCIGPDRVAWMGVAARTKEHGDRLHLVSRRPFDKPHDHGPIVIKNPDYTKFIGDDGKELPYHHGVEKLADGSLAPRYTIMAICAAKSGDVYFTTLYPFTLHRVRP